MIEEEINKVCELVQYGEEEKRCVNCNYITWASDKKDHEIINDMIKAGYDEPKCHTLKNK
mgnify:CR=1 FL=1